MLDSIKFTMIFINLFNFSPDLFDEFSNMIELLRRKKLVEWSKFVNDLFKKWISL